MDNYNFIDQQSFEQVSERRKKLKLYDTLSLIGIFVAWIIYFVFYGPIELLNNFLMFISFASIPLFIIVKIRNRKTFFRDYKSTLVEPNIKINFSGLNFHPERTIDQADFQNSKLFRRYNRFSGDDFFSGSVNGIKLDFSEIKVSYHHSSTGSSSSSSSTDHIFNGLFLTAELPFSLTSDLQIKPRFKIDKIPKILLGLIPDEYINPRNSFSRGFAEFDEHFTIASANNDEAKRLFSENLVNKLFDIAKEVKIFNSKLPTGVFDLSTTTLYPIYISISGNRIYFGASGIRLFDPKYKGSVGVMAGQLNNSIKIIKEIISFIESVTQGKVD